MASDLETLMTDSISSPGLREETISGFVAMEYYALILNRTFVVFITPEGLYGWKAVGPVTNSDRAYFEPLVKMLSDPETMPDIDEIRKLSRRGGGFFFPRATIQSAEVIYKPKWGMGGIPHCGRIRVLTTSGQSREFILLGSVDARALQKQILPTGDTA
jgi:hypothetical protein